MNQSYVDDVLASKVGKSIEVFLINKGSYFKGELLGQNKEFIYLNEVISNKKMMIFKHAIQYII